MYNEVITGYEAKMKIKEGVDIVANATKPTLGAVGMSAIIDNGALDPIITDDGVTVARMINLKDRYANMGALLMRKVASRTNQEAGDGTTTSMVLAQAFIDEAIKEIGHDSSRIIEVRERLNNGLEEVKAKLIGSAVTTDLDDVERIATISSLDDEVGKIISKAMKEVGKDGVLTIGERNEVGYESEVVKGLRFDKGLISPYLINDPERNQTVLDNPYVLCVGRKISTNMQIKNIFESIVKSGKTDVLVIADDVDGEALASLIMNHQRRVFNVACVQAPYTGSRKQDFVQDIAVLTGATVISEEAGMKLDDADLEHLGSAKRVIVTRDTTTIIEGTGESKEIALRVAQLRTAMDNTMSEADKELYKTRIAHLTGGIGLIKIGAYTDTELKAKKYKVEDAINATKAALEEGIVAGGGTALAQIKSKDPIFQKALVAPLRQMAINAGLDWHLVVTEVKNSESNTGYNFKTKKIEKLIETGIIDPVKVTRLALESAVSIASTLISAETIVVLEEVVDKSKD